MEKRRVRQVGVMLAPHRKRAREGALKLAQWAKGKGVKVVLLREMAELIGRPDLGRPDSEVAASDILVVLGGDGTVLSTARRVAFFETPILAADVGGFGFLSEIKDQDLLEALDLFERGDCEIERRMMLEARVGEEKICGLNEAVITKGAFSRIMNLKVFANGEPIAAFPADGLIVSTPTGSTAYSLSAGGPVVSPKLAVLIVTPICPHTLFARPLIVPDNEEIKVQIRSFDPEQEVMLTMDGQVGRHLGPRAEVVIRRAPHDALFVRFHPRSFYCKLRTKLHWGRAL